MGQKKDYRVVEEPGLPCPRCKMPTQVREHAVLREKHFRQPYYFSKWYFCTNRDCAVQTHMSEKYKVWNRNDAARDIKILEENQERINFFKSI
jgi:hypothetical protein